MHRKSFIKMYIFDLCERLSGYIAFFRFFLHSFANSFLLIPIVGQSDAIK